MSCTTVSKHGSVNMAEEGKAVDFGGIQVCVRARPLNDRERDAGYRNCISFDEATKQVVLSAVDRNTLIQLRGQTAKGYAFDRRFGPEHTSDNIYDDVVYHLVGSLFKGYNATVLAYGQTGAGKTLTMSGGKGIFGNSETGIIRRAAQQIIASVEALREKQKPGESTTVRAYALELYNEELRDLSSKVLAATATAAADKDGSSSEGGVRIAERPVGKDGRIVPEVVGVNTVEVEDAESLVNFFADCFENRAVAATKMNDQSSRSHAIYTVLINRTVVDVSEGGDKVRTVKMESRFNLVDLAGSERVKRSGVTGAAFKEAVHINGGLLALGNVIVALSGGQDGPEEDSDKTALLATGGGTTGGGAPPTARPSKAKHIPYRDSKLTRLLQDSLGGSALTVLISCISSCEADFEETNSTLKYANRACRIKNTPVANNQLLLEEDLLPLVPTSGTNGGSMSMMQMQLLLSEHNKMKEAREKREAEKREKEEKRLAELRSLREAESKTPGFQRLRMAQYDELRKKLVSSHGGKLFKGEVISDETLAGFKKRSASESEGGPEITEGRPSHMRPTSASRVGSPVIGRTSRPSSARLYSNQRVISSSGSPFASGRPTGSATPDILAIEPDILAIEADDSSTDAEDSEQQQLAGSNGYLEGGQPQEAAAGTGLLHDAALQLAATGDTGAREMHEMAVGTEFDEAEGAAAGAGSVVYWKQQQQKAVIAVDEGTCTSPMGSPSIKACYDYGTDPKSTAAGAAEPALGSSLVSRAASSTPNAISNAAAQSDAAQAGAAAATAAGAVLAAVTGGRPPLAPPATAASYAATHTAAFAVLAFNQPEPSEVQGTAAASQQSTEAEPAPVPVAPPQLLARFRVNRSDTLAVFRAVSTEDFADVASLLPPNTALPAADKMTYLLARLEVQPYTSQQLCEALDAVAAGTVSISTAVGPAVGCLMATFGTSLITDCIFDFEDPEQLTEVGLQQRLELWGLQIPHTSIRPSLAPEDRSARSPSPQPVRGQSPDLTPRRSSSSFTQASSSSPTGRRSFLNSNQQSPLQQQHSSQQQTSEQHLQQQQLETVTCWSSTDRLNVSIGLMYALCNLAKELGAAAGFCVPRPQLLRRWLQSGVKMKQVSPPTKLIYPPSAHDYAYYKSSTVAYFLVDEVQESLSKVLSMIKQGG